MNPVKAKGGTSRPQRQERFRAMRGPAESLILSGASRGVEKLRSPASFSLHRQARSLLADSNPNVAILTGFPVIQANGNVILENDGPLGSALLAAAFSALGWRVSIISDQRGKAIFDAMDELMPIDAPTPVRYFFLDGEKVRGVDLCRQLKREQLGHLISIERPGLARDGEYYNMRAQSISPYVPKTEVLFEDPPWTTSAYADGGNEIGMGKVGISRVAGHIHQGATIASRTKVDFLTMCGVSNWGAYGLLAFLRVGEPRLAATIDRFLNKQFDLQLFEAAREGGAVDGVTKEPNRTVDNLPLALHHEKLNEFRKLAETFA